MKGRRRSRTRRGRDHEFEALSAAAKAAAEATDLATALHEILDAAIELVGAEEGSIQLLDHASMSLHVEASRGLPTTALRPVGLGQGISGIVAVTGQPVLLSSPVDVGRYAGFVTKEREIHAALCVPLRARGEIVGVLSVNTCTPGSTLTDRDRVLITMFADHAALAIVNARLLADAHHHAVEVEMLRGVSARLTSSLDPAAVSRAIVSEAAAALGSPAGFLVLVPAAGRPSVAAATGMDAKALDGLCEARATFWPPHDLRVVERCAQDPALAPLAAALGDARVALIPIPTGEGEPNALLGLVVPDAAPSSWRRLVWTLASQAGIALTNALRHGAVCERSRALDAIVSALPDPVLLLDEQNRLLTMNPAAATAFRLSPHLDAGAPAVERLDPAIAAIALAAGPHAGGEVVCEDPRGRRTYRVTMTGPPDGAPGPRLVTCQDVTTEREVERRKQGVLSIIGHELRTPLTVIGGFAWTLLHRGDSLQPDDQRQALMSITTNSERLYALIEDLLAVSEVEDAPLALRLEDLDLEVLVERLVARAREQHPAIEVERIVGGSTQVRTDRLKVEQAIARVLDNAVKHGGSGCRIVVRLEPDPSGIGVVVSDDGPGIPASLRGHVFDPFFQLDPSNTRRVGGAGVGLSVAQSLMAALGGGISAAEAPGGGARFTIRIPRASVTPSVTLGRAQAYS